MHGAPVLGWLLAALTGAAGLYCLARLCTSAPRAGCTGGTGGGGADRESDAAEALMGLGMAAMALPPAHHGGLPPAAWAAVFAAVAAWFAAASLRRSGDRAHRLHHMVGAAAMLCMVLAVAAPGGPGGHAEHAGMTMASSSSSLPAPLTGALLLYFGAHALRTAGGLLRPEGAVAGAAGLPLLQTPGMPRACRLVMGVGMVAMLLTG